MPKKRKRAIKGGVTKVESQPLFRLVLDLGDIYYEANAETITEAMDKLEVDKFKLKTYGIFTLKSQGKKSQYKATPFEIRKMLVNKTSKELLADRLLTQLK